MPVGGHAHLRLRLFWYKGETSLLDKHRTLFTIIFIKSCWWWCTLLVHTGPHEVRQLLMTRMLQRLQTAHGGVTTSVGLFQNASLSLWRQHRDCMWKRCGLWLTDCEQTNRQRSETFLPQMRSKLSFDQSVRLRRLLVEAQIKFSPVTVGRGIWRLTPHWSLSYTCSQVLLALLIGLLWQAFSSLIKT